MTAREGRADEGASHPTRLLGMAMAPQGLG